MSHVDLDAIFKYKLHEVQELEKAKSIEGYRVNWGTGVIWIKPLGFDSMQRKYWAPCDEFENHNPTESDLF